MEHPFPWQLPCRLLGQQIKTHLLSEVHGLAQLLWGDASSREGTGLSHCAGWGQQKWGRTGSRTLQGAARPRQQAPCRRSSLCVQSRAGSNLSVGTPVTLRTRHKGNSIFPKPDTISGGFQMDPG